MSAMAQPPVLVGQVTGRPWQKQSKYVQKDIKHHVKSLQITTKWPKHAVFKRYATNFEALKLEPDLGAGEAFGQEDGA